MPRAGEQRANFTAEILRTHLHYDVKTGIWTWLDPDKQRRVKDGRADKMFPKEGGKTYRRLRFLGKNYLSHRLAWFYVTGSWPPNLVDHKDRNGQNNIWTNFRLSTVSQNSANAGLSKNNSSGWKGVAWVDCRRKWRSQIRTGGGKHLGYFNCPAAAHFAYLVAANKIYGEFACAG